MRAVALCARKAHTGIFVRMAQLRDTMLAMGFKLRMRNSASRSCWLRLTSVSDHDLVLKLPELYRQLAEDIQTAKQERHLLDQRPADPCP